MSVYVDRLLPCVPNKNWPYDKSCHLIADSLNELHEFALKLGLKKEWFQDHKKHPHYDLTEGMRKKAIQLGAIEI
jgi:hypothetical protein